MVMPNEKTSDDKERQKIDEPQSRKHRKRAKAVPGIGADFEIWRIHFKYASLMRRCRSLMCCGQDFFMKASTAQISSSFRTPPNAGISLL